MKNHKFLATLLLLTFMPASISAVFAETWTTYNNSNTGGAIGNNKIQGVAVDSGGVKWLGTAGGGAAKFTGTSWQKYTTSQGLSNNTIRAAAVDSSNNKWFATAGGVSKYTGTSWTKYTTGNSGLASNNCYSIAAEGVIIWVGTYDKGACKFTGTSWTTYNTGNSSLTNLRVNGVAVEAGGTKWFATMDGVDKFDGTTWTHYKTQLVSDDVYAAAVAPNNDKWFGTLSGVNRFTGTSWTTYTTGQGLAKNDTRSIAASPDGVIWAGSNGSGVSKFTGAAPWMVYNSSNSGLVNNYVWTIAAESSSKLWFGTNLGVSFLDLQGIAPPVAAFTGSPTSGNKPLTVNFTDQSTNSPTSWSWTFGDGGTSTAQNPSHVYNNAGTYTVSLTASNAGGSDAETKTNYITATDPLPGKATNPSPTNGATGVDENANLSWAAGSGATSHDVYFGTANPPPFQGNQTATSYDPGTMALDVTHYWRIDEKNAVGTTTGNLWSFTTGTPSGVWAFPGAEGFGTNTTGGRGGTVIKVTNLNDSGTGSLRAACSASGARIVVFEVSGTITLSSDIAISNPYITIAGQTSPGGICLRKYGINVRTHDVVIRYIRSRPGNESGTECHAININNASYNVVLDHCSLSWGVDEDASTAGSSHDVTIQRCIISEGLRNAGHSEGNHSCGFINNPSDTNISLHHNLWAQNDERNPRSHGGVVDVVNNVIYHPGSSCAYLGGTGYFQTNWIKNYMLGASIYSVKFLSGTSGLVYVEGNKDPHRTSDTQDEWDVVNGDAGTYRSSTAFDAPPVTETDVFPTNLLFDNVLDNSGATVPVRDAVDTRIVNNVRDGTGSFIDSPSEVGGWPTLSGGSPPTDTDNDGMPDDWETARGLNPNADDSAGDRDSDGYTNIEEYINGIPW